MSNNVISVRNIGKRYYLGATLSPDTLRDHIMSAASRLTGRHKKEDPVNKKQEFWALKNISFDVAKGEILGLVGPNGAGKSTLLKILTGITEPSEGLIEMKGRVGSLLEVGTGFHQELTGRENIYMNGAILGMKRAEINSKFDEIVSFSGVEIFIDTPIKRYSSGMRLRLGFAVAAYLEPEILLIDEVLAVGDAVFQKKCLGKMDEIAKDGRTIIFVSHNLGAITSLCSKAMCIDQGKLIELGKAAHIVSNYLNSVTSGRSSKVWDENDLSSGNDDVRLISIDILDGKGNPCNSISITNEVKIKLRYKVYCNNEPILPKVHIVNPEGITVFVSHDTSDNWRFKSKVLGATYESTITIPGNFFSDGQYSVSPALVRFNPDKVYIFLRDVVAFEVVDDFSAHSARGNYKGRMPGVVRPLLPWVTDCC